jgi:hypothetical protein
MKIPFAWLFRTRRAKAALLIAAVYVCFYVVLSLCGEYRGNISSLERLGIITRGVSDVWEWQPAFVVVTHYPEAPGQPRFREASLLGYCFLPLVMIDQGYCHATKPIKFGL